MVAYPWSIAGYFVLGALGACAFLVITLLFDKSVAIIDNRVITSKRAMASLYITFGGVLASVVNVAANPDFGPNQFALAFASGIGWPAIAAGIGAGKRVGEIDEKARKAVGQNAGLSDAKATRQLEEAKDYFERRLEDTRAAYQALVDNVSRERDRAISYLTEKLSDGGG